MILPQKQQQETHHRHVFNSASIYQNIITLRNTRKRGGLGVLPPKNFKKIGTKSCNSNHF